MNNRKIVIVNWDDCELFDAVGLEIVAHRRSRRMLQVALEITAIVK
jgi:hypothetical protein